MRTKEERRNYHREYEKKNKERIREYKRKYMQIPRVKERRQKYLNEYRKKNKVILSDKRKKYKQKNRDKISKQSREYRNRPETIKKRKEWFKKNRERLTPKRREYYKNNSEMIRKKFKEYRMNNIDKIKEHQKEYEQKLEIIQMRKEYEQNPMRKEKHLKSSKKWFEKKRKEDPIFKLRQNLRSRLGRAFKQYSKTGKQYSSKKYGIDFTAIIKHLQPFPKDIENHHVDHIIPLSRFDFNNAEHIKIAFRPENHQWLTKEENLCKNNKLIIPHSL